MSETSDRTRASDEVSMFTLFHAGLRRWRLFIVFPVLAAALFVSIGLLGPPRFVATATFVRPGEARGGTMESILAQRVGLLTAEERNSLNFYATLLESREVLRAVASDPYRRKPDDPPVALEALVVGQDAADPLTETVKWLRDVIDISTDPQSGFVELRVVTGEPLLAEQIANRLLFHLDAATTHIQQMHAAGEAAFIAEQLAAARDSLGQAEESLRRFLERNRTFRDAPHLVLEYEHLQRQVVSRDRLFGSLQEAYYDASINALRDTPSVVVVDRPEGSAQPVRRRIVLRAILGLVAGFVIAVAVAGAGELFTKMRMNDPTGYEETRRLLRIVKTDVKRPWQRKA